MKRNARIIVMIVIALALLAAGAVFGWFFVLRDDAQKAENKVQENVILNMTPGAVKESEEIPEEIIDAERVRIRATNLEIPWALDLLSDDKIIFTERNGRVRVFNLTNEKFEEVNFTLPVLVRGEGGLLGVVMHPQYVQNNFVYFYYTYGTASDSKNKVVRYKFDGARFKDEKIIIDNIPGSLFHNGGRIKFGQDGYLYIGTGDYEETAMAQDKNSLAGKILRVRDDGSIPDDNPFSESPIYTLGHRNVQGLAWDEEGRMFASEHGNRAHDEINFIEKGKNYGWPEITGNENRQGMVTPFLESGNDTWAPSGMAFAGDSLFFVGLRGEALYEIEDPLGAKNFKMHFKNEYGRLREVVARSGLLFIFTNNSDGRGAEREGDDKLIQVNPEKL